MKDKYETYDEMEINESENFKIKKHDNNSNILIMAIHGGEIEPLTSDIANLIASNEYNFYSFEGDKSSNDEDLHITSIRFENKDIIEILKTIDISVSIHGSKDEDSIVYIGGLDYELRNFIENNIKNIFLEKHKNFCIVNNVKDDHKFSAINKKNIVNRNKREMGVQIELSQGFRKKIVTSLKRDRKIKNILALYDFSNTISEAIKKYKKWMNL
jgi:phage replication-related protein YjqB (UPF0714/DUF867 family)